MVQQLRDGDVRTLHRFQLNAQRVLLAQSGAPPVVSWLLPKVLPLLLHSPLLPLVQRRLFFGAPLPPLDPAFSFRGELQGIEEEFAPVAAGLELA